MLQSFTDGIISIGTNDAPPGRIFRLMAKFHRAERWELRVIYGEEGRGPTDGWGGRVNNIRAGVKEQLIQAICQQIPRKCRGTLMEKSLKTMKIAVLEGF